MPLLYQPKFCCNCGEKIDRPNWQVWTSRRFCDVCESEQKHHDLLPRVVVALGIFAGLFGITGYMRQSDQAQVARLTQSVDKRPPTTSVHAASPDKVPGPPAAQPPAAGIAANGTRAAATVPPQLAAVARNDGSGGRETVYHCGAITKKGSPCSRRVKTPGRCWQHKGQPSSSEEASLTKDPR